MPIHRRRILFIALSLVMTFVVLRVYLALSPNSNFDVGPYNIHHLFTGLLLIAAASGAGVGIAAPGRRGMIAAERP